MKSILIAVVLLIVLSGCSIAQKTRELGSSMTNIQHPIIFFPGLALYKIGKTFEEKKEEK